MEIIRINSKKSRHVSDQFANCWLARYRRSNRCVYDNGEEFLGWEFVQLLGQYGIKPVHTNVKNPQANAICERAHQTIGDILHTTLQSYPPANLAQANQIVDNALVTAMYAPRCAVTVALNTSAGALVSNRDMIMDIPLIADLILIRKRRQQIIDMNLQRENSKNISTSLQNF